MAVNWPLLDPLTEEERRLVLSLARRRRFARKEVIFHEGDSGDTLHLLRAGHVALRVHTPLGDVATVRIVRPGEFFGELALVAPAPRSATAVALDTVETVCLLRDQMAELRQSYDGVDVLLIDALAAEIRRLAAQLVDVMYLPVEKRLWRRVSALSQVFGTDEVPATRLPITQDVLAEVTGCTRPTANRVLRAGEDDGVIRMSRGRLEILDAEGVARRGR
jgi:CRP-like cAMP-binding protein